MATFNVFNLFTYAIGTAANDTFNIDATYSTAIGLDGDDTFNFNTVGYLVLDGGAGNDSFSSTTICADVLVSCGDGNDSVYMAVSFLNNVFGGAGDDWIGIGGGATNVGRNTLDGGDGNDFIGVTNHSSWLLGGAGNDALRATGDSNALDGGNDNDSLYVSGQFDTLVGGNGNDWLGANGHHHMFFGGDGSDWIGVTGDSCQLHGESGDDTVFAAGPVNVLRGGDGNDWVGVSGTSNKLSGDAGSDYLAATGNGNAFDGGPGNDQIVAAAGHLNNWYVFFPGSGQDSITGFEGANGDLIDLRAFGLADFAALAPFMSQVGADTVIALNGADVLTLKNINKTTLVANDFDFV
jgi:Ca2+-binding RTX toxin-like protein